MSTSGGRPEEWADDPGYNDYGVRFNVPREEMYRPSAPPQGAPRWDPTPQQIRGVRYHPKATTILILGIVSIVLCAPLGPLAWTMGNTAMREIRFSGYHYANEGTVQAGRILGAIASILIAVYLVVVVLLVMSVASSPTTTGS